MLNTPAETAVSFAWGVLSTASVADFSGETSGSSSMKTNARFWRSLLIPNTCFPFSASSSEVTVSERVATGDFIAVKE
ncbi:MAG: hypothetical protein ACWGO1_04460, partial [Anaerolineales bacterium]